MSDRRPHDLSPERALEALCREARDEASPDVDWQRAEARLFASIERGDAPRHALAAPGVARARSIAAGAALVLAAAAGVVVALGGAPGEGVAPGARAVAASATAKLARGQVIEAGATAVELDAPGVAAVRLAPRARIEVVDAPGAEGARVTLALASGTIHAEVVHRDLVEGFAIDVGGVRVVDVGTVFDVSRDADRVSVDVGVGAVEIVPRGASGARRVVRAPAHVAFTLASDGDAVFDAAPRAEIADAPADAAAPLVAVEPARRVAAAVGVAAPRETLAPADYAEHVARFAGAVDACHRAQSASGTTRVTVRSELRLVVSPDGVARLASFEPPLSPALHACATRALEGVRFPSATRTTVIATPVVLGE